MSSTVLLGKRIVSVMPPSVQKVFRTLQSGKRMHVGDIESKTKYSPRTVRQALRHLKNAQLITQIPDMYDMRRHYYMAVGS
ncbi:MAG: MarR family transcriptional regulator [Candidatus Hodarchaeales archaeon]|jgi:Mn-dependent DtxR family transcriptional regulator